MIRFYFKKGRWHVTSGKTVVNAQQWGDAINRVKCMNHALRMASREPALAQPASAPLAPAQPPGKLPP